MQIAIFAVILAALVAGCTVTSIDAVKARQLKLCETITDEALRVDCIERVGREPADEGMPGQ